MALLKILFHAYFISRNSEFSMFELFKVDLFTSDNSKLDGLRKKMGHLTIAKDETMHEDDHFRTLVNVTGLIVVSSISIAMSYRIYLNFV